MKSKIYYLAHMVLNIVFLIAFFEKIKIHILSVIPIFLIVLMAFQATFFRVNTQNDSIGDTAYSVGNTVRLTDEEQTLQYSYLKHSFLLCIPFEIPLIFFFSSYWKLLATIPYILAYLIGGVVFKIKIGKQIKSRVNIEKKELQEQIKKEELGLK